MDFRQLHGLQSALSKTVGVIFCGKPICVHSSEGAEFLGGERCWGPPAFFFHRERLWLMGYFLVQAVLG